MKRLRGVSLFVTLSCIITATSQRKTSPRAVGSYCEFQDETSLITFNFTELSSSPTDHILKDDKSGESIRLRLCSPLRQKCDGVDGYRICLTKDNKEIGLGMKEPDRVDPGSGKLGFVFWGDTCRGNEKFSVHVLMKCKQEAGFHSEPIVLPHDPYDCNYYIVWETKAACGPENVVNCTAIGSAGEHYDLSSLMVRSENYIVPMNDESKSEIILNVCHSVVFDYDVRCSQFSGACLRKSEQNQRYKFTGLGDVHESPKFDNVTKELTLTYGTGVICTKNVTNPHVETTINFICDYNSTNTAPIYVGGAEVCHYRLTWKTAAACSVEALKNHSIATAGTCKVTNPLTNIEYNMHELMNTNYRINTTNGLEYSFQVCGPVSDGSCVSGTGACIVKNKTSTGVANAKLKWSQGGPYLNYTNGDECGNNQRRYTQIAFFCGVEKSASGPIIMENENCSLIVHWNTPLVCEKRINCETKNGEINLVPLIRWNENYVAEANGSQFHINICRPLVPKAYLTCLHGSSVCHVIPEENGKFTNETTLGYTDKNPFFDDKKNVMLRYTGGSTCPEDSKATISSNITFLCDYNAGMGNPRYNYYRNCTYSFDWKTSIVCPVAEGRWEKDCKILNPDLSHNVDLNPLRQTAVYSVASRIGDEYKISICGEDNFCKGSSICKGNAGYGTSSAVVFDYNENLIKLKFSNGTKCKTGLYSSEIHLICEESEGIGQPKLIGEYSCGAVFEWKTIVVCVNYTMPEISDIEPKIAETIEKIAKDEMHVGTKIAIVIVIAIFVGIAIYLWSSSRRDRLRFFFKSLTSGRDQCRAQYTKVDASEEAELLLDIGETTQCVEDSNSDDEILDG